MLLKLLLIVGHVDRGTASLLDFQEDSRTGDTGKHVAARSFRLGKTVQVQPWCT